jgi:hypothetical protein
VADFALLLTTPLVPDETVVQVRRRLESANLTVSYNPPANELHVLQESGYPACRVAVGIIAAESERREWFAVRARLSRASLDGVPCLFLVSAQSLLPFFPRVS